MEKNNIYLNRLDRIFGFDEEEQKENLISSLSENVQEVDIKKDAFCSNCQAFIVDERVTYDECCDTCKFKVSYL